MILRNLTILIILTAISFRCFGQDSMYEIKLNPIQYVEDLKQYKNENYCTGYTFQTDNYDGYATDAFLNKYNDSLNLIWSIKINKAEKNQINSIIKHNNKIYALVTLGKNTNQTTNNEINLYVISENGKIEETINFGKSYSQPTNIIIKGDELFFGYSESSSIYYSNGVVIPILLKYNLKTKEFEKFKGENSYSYPQKTIASNSKIFVVGKYNKIIGNLIQEQFVLCYSNGKFTEEILHTNKSEYFLDSYIVANELIILTVFPGVYGDKEKYIKYQFIDIVTQEMKSKIIYFKELNWSNVSFDTYSTESSTWLIVEDNNNPISKYFVLIDENGKEKSKITLDKKNKYVKKFIIENERIITVVDKSLKILKN